MWVSRDYAEFLVAFNGGEFYRTVRYEIPNPTRNVRRGLMQQFFGEPADGIETYGIVRRAEIFTDRIPANYLAFADSSGSELVCFKFDDRRTTLDGVWHWNYDAFWIDAEMPAFHWLAASFHEFLSMLVYDPDDEEQFEILPIFQAVERGNFLTVRKYLAAGAEVDARNGAGQTLLMAAAKYRWPRIVSLLLEHGADVSARDNQGQSPLHHAAQHSIDSVKLLLAAGADTKARDRHGKSVLAAWSFRADQILRAHGAEE